MSDPAPPYEDSDDLDFEGNIFSNTVGSIQTAISAWHKENKDIVKYSFYVLLLLGYFAYFIWCMYCQTKEGKIGEEGNVRLIVLTVVIVLGICLQIFFTICKPDFTGMENSFDRFMNKYGFV